MPATPNPPAVVIAPVVLLELAVVLVEIILEPVMFSLAVSVPLTFAPVPVMTSIFVLPAELKFMLPFADGILILLLPLAIPDEDAAAQLNAPLPSVCRKYPFDPPDI